ncbi:MAG: hypothetical protein NVSMB1_22670 [Polyangiales bacterium]
MTRLFQVLAVVFAAAALWHAGAIVVPLDPSSSAQRHALFVGINAGLAALMLRRPWWFPLLFAVLMMQQLWSHGHALVARAREGRVDVLSMAVILALPIVLVLLVRDAKRRKKIG